MKILISTGIYPPELGGPAEYAKNLKELWSKQGHKVFLKIFSRFNFFPPGIRHIFFFLNIILSVIRADLILILDTFSAALPTLIMAKLCGKKTILRTGGDFLWEGYVERTGEKILLSEFYRTPRSFSLKEKIVFSIIKFILKNVDAIIWSTEWQKDMFIMPYELQNQNHFVIENYYGEKKLDDRLVNREFVGSARNLKWKNLEILKHVFSRKEIIDLGITLNIAPLPHDEFLKKIRDSYAVILVSLGDISPNTILDAISLNKPFIVTKETGLYPRIKDIAIFVDPTNPNDILEKVVWLSREDNYVAQKKKIEDFAFTHTWAEIAGEYLEVYEKIK